MLNFIGRLILIPIGFILACLATAFVLVTLGAARITHALQSMQVASTEENFEILSYAVALMSATTILPALLVIIVGEIARLRSILYYIAGGGIASAAIPVLAYFSYMGMSSLWNDIAWPVFATAGFFGGFIYWLIAGRAA